MKRSKSLQKAVYLEQASEIIEIFKVKLKWSKSSRLLQRIAFLVINVTRSAIWYDLYSLQLV